MRKLSEKQGCKMTERSVASETCKIMMNMTLFRQKMLGAFLGAFWVIIENHTSFHLFFFLLLSAQLFFLFFKKITFAAKLFYGLFLNSETT